MSQLTHNEPRPVGVLSFEEAAQWAQKGYRIVRKVWREGPYERAFVVAIPTPLEFVAHDTMLSGAPLFFHPGRHGVGYDPYRPSNEDRETRDWVALSRGHPDHFDTSSEDRVLEENEDEDNLEHPNGPTTANPPDGAD